jgi:glycosyltransferase involved in cell wall biosynthesis
VPSHFPSISVIIPTFNRREMLLRALTSVFQQTARCSEVIVVDDASTDGSYEYMAAAMARHWRDRIRWVALPENRGAAAARNAGIVRADGEIVAFLDSDDHWLPQKLEVQAKYMGGNPGFLISHTREKWLRRGQHLNQKNKHIPRHGDVFSHCLELCAVGMSTVMAHRSLFDRVGLFDEDMRCCEDYEFWLRVSCRYPFLLVDRQLTIKEGGRQDQVSFQYRQGMDRLRIDAIDRLVRSGALNPLQQEQAREEMKRKCMIYGKGCIKHGRIDEGMQYLALAGAAEMQQNS